jgi:ABC-type maltose transport system permease subunit
VTDIVGQGIVRDRRARLKLPSSQDVVSVLILVFCGVLVLYPMVYLVVLSVNVGDPLTFRQTNTASSTTKTCSTAGG